MPKFTFTFEGEQAEIDAMLLRLSGAAPAAMNRAVDESDLPDRHAADSAAKLLTRDEVEVVWNWCGPEAKRIWAEIATRPDGYPFKELQASVQLTGLEVAGRLSSLGHGFKQFKAKGKEHPIVKDYYLKIYRMDLEIATWVRELAEVEGL